MGKILHFKSPWFWLIESSLFAFLAAIEVHRFGWIGIAIPIAAVLAMAAAAMLVRVLVQPSTKQSSEASRNSNLE